MSVKVHRLRVVMSLSQLRYDVRRRGARSGRTFFSEAIAVAWAHEESVRTGASYDVYEITMGF